MDADLQTREMMLHGLARVWINWFRSLEDGIVFDDPREWPSKETAETYGLDRAQLARLTFPGVLEYVGAYPQGTRPSKEDAP